MSTLNFYALSAIRFVAWLLAVGVAAIAAAIWTMPAFCIVVVWGGYQGWEPRDWKDWMLPSAPITAVNSLFSRWPRPTRSYPKTPTGYDGPP
jgi:hypothetical protein